MSRLTSSFHDALGGEASDKNGGVLNSEKCWRIPERTRGATSGGLRPALLGMTPPSQKSHPVLLPILVHSRARKALGFTGVSNKWLYCVFPVWGWCRPEAGVLGTTPWRAEAGSGLRWFLGGHHCFFVTSWLFPASPLSKKTPSSSSRNIRGVGCGLKMLPTVCLHPYWYFSQPPCASTPGNHRGFYFLICSFSRSICKWP